MLIQSACEIRAAGGETCIEEVVDPFARLQDILEFKDLRPGHEGEPMCPVMHNPHGPWDGGLVDVYPTLGLDANHVEEVRLIRRESQ